MVLVVPEYIIIIVIIIIIIIIIIIKMCFSWQASPDQAHRNRKTVPHPWQRVSASETQSSGFCERG